MSELPEDLKALTAGAPEVADWPGLVRAEVRARHRRRAAASATVALVLVGVAGVGVVYALDGPTQRLVAQAPTPEPAATPSPPASPSPAPSPPGEPAAVPSTPPVERTPAPPAPEPSAAPPASRVPSPAPAYPPARNTITLEITVTPERPVVGEEVTIQVVARGDKAKPYLTQFTYDRRRRSQTYPIAACLQQEPVAPEPGVTSDSVTFTYTEAGPDTITVRADSGCSYYQGSNGASKDVQVAPAPEPTSSPGP